MEKLRIIDIGAADFEIDDKWLYLNLDVETILFEPDLRSYSALHEKGFSVYNYALGEKSEKRHLNLTKKPACSSFLKPNMAFLEKFPEKERWHIIEQVEVETKPLDEFSINADFIKIDTQGTELEILKGSKKTLQHVLGLEIEVSFLEIYQNQPLFGDICHFLKLQGFEFYDFVTEYRYSRKKLNRKGQLAFADALFLRTPENLIQTNYEKRFVYQGIAKAYNKEDLIHPLKSKLI